MSCTAQTLSDRFALIVDGLCRVVAAHSARDRSAVPMIVLVWSRLRRIAARFARIAAQAGAGKIPAARTRPPRIRLPSPASPQRLPRGFAWLVRAMPESACFGSQLSHLLAEPEMAALLEAEPRLARVLGPLCRMLAVEPIAGTKVSAGKPTPPPRSTPPAPTLPRQRPERRQPGRLSARLVRALSGRIFEPA